MKRVFIFLFSVFMPVVANAYIEKSTAVLRVLDKDAGKVHVYSVTVDDDLQFGKLNITVKNCKQTDPFQAEDFFAFVEISERDKGPIYGGWMSRNEPGQNPLQHPDYDVWLVKCE